jgi:hypothetical protein
MVLISAEEIAAEKRKQPSGWEVAGQWQHGAREFHVACRPVGEPHGVDEAESRDAVRLANRE